MNKERKRLKEVDHFTILDYIKTSIEILMNMKMEESEGNKEEKDEGKKKKHQKLQKSLNSSVNGTGVLVGGVISDTESLKSMDEPPKDYE